MTNTVGPLLRHWRSVRRLSQLDLSVASGVSQRHLSFVETGRSHPSRQLLRHLSSVMDLPLRDRNTLLQAGGFAPAYTTTSWDDPEMAEARGAIEFMLDRHQPYPAIVMDRHWNLVSANPAAGSMMARFIGPAALAEAEGNAMRLIAHPDGMRRAITNWSEAGGHLLDRIRREASAHPDDHELQNLCLELTEMIGEVAESPADAPLAMMIPTRLEAEGGSISMFSMLATVGSALDVTLSELVVELFYPADDESAARMRNIV